MPSPAGAAPVIGTIAGAAPSSPLGGGHGKRPVHAESSPDPRRQRGRRPGRLSAQRSHRDLPDHAVLPDGGVVRSMVHRGPAEPVGHGPARGRDAERGRRGRRATRGAAGRGADDDVHRVAGPAADAAQHVQDRRRADADGDPRRRPRPGRPGAVDLRRPRRRHGGAADRLRAPGVQLGPGGGRLRRACPRRGAGGPPPVPALLRRLPHLPRGGADRAADAGADPRPDRRRAGPRPPPPGSVAPTTRSSAAPPRTPTSTSRRARWSTRSTSPARPSCRT